MTRDSNGHRERLPMVPSRSTTIAVPIASTAPAKLNTPATRNPMRPTHRSCKHPLDAPLGRIRRLSATAFVSTLAIVVALPGVSIAQAPGAATEAVAPVSGGETVFTLIAKGGLLMWPIGLCSVVVLMFAIERAISLRRGRTLPVGLLEKLFETLPVDDNSPEARERATALLTKKKSILGSVLASGISRLHRGLAPTSTILEEAALKEAHLLQRRIRPFSIVETLAPLLGLLGTIYGMISCFENAVSVDAASRAQSLASGIYVALVTTAAGLSVAIPAKVLFHLFEGKVDRIVDGLEESIELFLDHYFSGDEPLVFEISESGFEDFGGEESATSSSGESGPQGRARQSVSKQKQQIVAKALKRSS
jgi:biopolymer transport protein ExbB